MTTQSDQVEANALKPRFVTVDGQTVEQHSLSDQIAAARFAESRDAAAASGNAVGNGLGGIQFLKFRPPGA